MNPLGVKGVGEAGTIGCSPAVVNSVVDALSPLGVRHLDMPLTPEKIWKRDPKEATHDSADVRILRARHWRRRWNCSPRAQSRWREA